MTLDTHIVIKNPDVSPETVLGFINRELLRAEAPRRSDRPTESDLTDSFWRKYYVGRSCIGNASGQGLGAIAEVWFRTPVGVGPITAWYQTGWNCDGSIDEDEAGERDLVDFSLVTGAMVVSFDTAYGYQQAGAGCGDLHAYFIERLFLEYGPLAWLDESYGEWFELSDASSEEQGTALRTRLGDPAAGENAVKAEAWRPAVVTA